MDQRWKYDRDTCKILTIFCDKKGNIVYIFYFTSKLGMKSVFFVKPYAIFSYLYYVCSFCKIWKVWWYIVQSVKYLYSISSDCLVHAGHQSNVDTSYLQYKWGELFLLLDVNKDGMLDNADTELQAANYVRLNNLTAREVRQNGQGKLCSPE